MGENYYTGDNLLEQTSNFNRFITSTLDLSNSINKKTPRKTSICVVFYRKITWEAQKQKMRHLRKLRRKKQLILVLKKLQYSLVWQIFRCKYIRKRRLKINIMQDHCVKFFFTVNPKNLFKWH